MGPLRTSCAILGSLEAILAVLETSSSRLGSHLGRLGGVLEASWSPFWAIFDGLGEFLVAEIGGIFEGDSARLAQWAEAD